MSKKRSRKINSHKFTIGLDNVIYIDNNIKYEDSIGSGEVSIKYGIATIYNFGMTYKNYGKGHGRKLLTFIVNYLLENGIKKIQMEANGTLEGKDCFHNISLAKFYKRILLENNPEWIFIQPRGGYRIHNNPKEKRKFFRKDVSYELTGQF